jgi:hypothetical protein
MTGIDDDDDDDDDGDDVDNSCDDVMMLQETIGKVIVCLNNKETYGDGDIQAIVDALVPTVEREEMVSYIYFYIYIFIHLCT